VDGASLTSPTTHAPPVFSIARPRVPDARALPLLALLLVPQAVKAAQAPPPAPPRISIMRAAGRITIDGILDEPDWQTAGLIQDLTQQSPVPGGPTPYHTEVRLLTDGATIYIGVRCVDPEPGRIATHTMLRDADLSSDDAVGLVLDTFGDHRTGYIFQVNAAGARFDGLIATAEDVSADWDGIWDAKVGRDASGWVKFRGGRDALGPVFPLFALATVEAIFNLGTLGRNDTSATPMSDLFRGGIP